MIKKSFSDTCRGLGIAGSDVSTTLQVRVLHDGSIKLANNVQNLTKHVDPARPIQFKLEKQDAVFEMSISPAPQGLI
ncbi:uncharacterized protein PHALS_05830 [Plasmopara halstedii]|uniref:Uncharacterized protein n=1 Tax=Plasmopara halstedii TaxID=4781 RepID=A0A0P1AB61_PLAHL|nr:uncharacterized protein PHALS_05830 [Plasmopara halstedii]CEG37774.1 hypothetical protein PHALS_05830 [Plasmopara halstedii]|eukprot:XP_024574143.1 hypothetical protein PHALS_05830 [Plasmopara halstedii]